MGWLQLEAPWLRGTFFPWGDHPLPAALPPHPAFPTSSLFLVPFPRPTQIFFTLKPPPPTKQGALPPSSLAAQEGSGVEASGAGARPRGN